MSKKILSIAALAMLLPTMALAGNVSFTTTGSFSGPLPAGTLTFTGVTVTNQSAFPLLLTSFGVIDVAKQCTASNSVCKGTAQENFTLTIHQTVPSAGSGNLTATITGVVAYNPILGLYNIVFTQATTSINGVQYIVAAGNFFCSNPSKPSCQIDLPGIVINAIGAPEPTSELMLGLGALGLLGFATFSRKIYSSEWC